MAIRIAEAFARHKDEAHKIILTLSSPGGSLDQGAEVVRLLDRIGQTHMLVTSVDAGGICASMCVPVYLQGQRRIAAANAEFMFHEVNFRDFFSKEKDQSVPDSAIGAETDRFFDTYFETAGVPQSWIRKVRADVAGGNEVWKTGRELLDEKSGIVQQLMVKGNTAGNRVTAAGQPSTRRGVMAFCTVIQIPHASGIRTRSQKAAALASIPPLPMP